MQCRDLNILCESKMYENTSQMLTAEKWTITVIFS